MPLIDYLYPHRFTYLHFKKRQIDAHVRRAADCRRVQRELLFEKLRRNEDSAFGREHGFSEIRTVEDFRHRLPVSGYEYFRPYAERAKAGEVSAMFGPGTEILMFSMTSGTTSQPKFIPITNHFFREYKKAWNIWGLAVYRDHPDLVTKFALHFGSDWQQSRTSGGFYCGNISGLVVETRPRIARPMFLLPALLNKVSGTANKQYVALRLSLPKSRVGMIGTANPLTLIHLARLANENAETLIRDVFDGTLSNHVEIDPEVRRGLHPRLSQRHPRRARWLERVLESSGHFYPRDFWPELSVVSVWMAGSMSVYVPKLREYYGDLAYRDHGLSASEGHMTTPLGDGTRAGLLDFATHYFEFIPEEEHAAESPTVLEADELEEGKNYYILLTTSSGLYRYDIHDVVRCVGFEGTCPLLEFLHKGAHFSSMTGEKLSEHQVVEAVDAALNNLNLSMEHYTLAPVSGSGAHYVLLTESDLPTTMQDRLASEVDQQLSRVNCEYEDRLASRRLAPCVVRQVPEGTFNRYREEFITRDGASAEQFKHPFLCVKPDVVEQFLQPVG